MTRKGWRQLLAGHPWFREPGGYPLPAYSEFMPPPRVGRKPCGAIDASLFDPKDPQGWRISAHEEMHELRPGLDHIGRQLMHAMLHLGRRDPAHGISPSKLGNNPFWPAELQESGAPPHERYILILPLALSRTQDDKGRVRWTLFGSSQEGPAQPFLRSPGSEEFLDRLLKMVNGDYLVTFEPFATLPADVRKAYRAGKLHLIPFPGSLMFWGTVGYRALGEELATAMQIPLLHLVARHEAPGGIRVPQSGWFHEKTADHPEPRLEHGPFRGHFQRTTRWARVDRDTDEIEACSPSEDKVARVLFSTEENDVGLYGKPMARNAQIWDKDHHLILDGPNATPEELHAAHERVRAGGTFGYRFFYPPMQVGVHHVYWHRPLVAYAEDGEARVVVDAPTGYLTAHLAGRRVEMWPRIHLQPRTALPHRSLATLGMTPVTFHRTARRSFEVAYWNTIKRLSAGRFINKDNADVVLDRPTQRRLKHRRRDLDPLGDFLIAHHRKSGARVKEMRFPWRTDFPFGWSDGWRRNQHAAVERNLIVRIPGRNRKRAIILADHYDTAYMEDVFEKGARIAAPGADDNASATAVLMLAAPIFMELKPACDIWLVHLTGEEFPSDCLGARHLTQAIVEGAIDVEIAAIFVMDMIAHNNDKQRDIFQISPGEGSRALQLAQVASDVTRLWNALPQGRRRGRGKRSKSAVPKLADYPRLRGEIREHTHPRSTVYNTDAQIFSDAGLPVVLFMENYDIDRHGYHDSHDIMENIDLDYGSALAAIAIETVAQVALEGGG